MSSDQNMKLQAVKSPNKPAIKQKRVKPLSTMSNSSNLQSKHVGSSGR